MNPTPPVLETALPISALPDEQANLTVDFGFLPGYSLGNRVWLDDGAAGSGTLNDGIINPAENTQGIDGVSVTLLDSTGNPVSDGFGHTTILTTGGGYYRFDGLTTGQYKVRIDAINFTSTKPLFNYISSTNDFNSLENNAGSVNTLDNHDMGIDSTTYLTNGIVSGLIDLSPGKVPLTEPDTAGNWNGLADLALVDAQANLTVDFGFLPGYSLGNRVWRDDGTGGGTINDGIRNGTEAGIQGVSVTLLDNTGNPIQDGFGNSTITTDASGYYRFDGLVPGTYKVRIDASNWTTGTKPLLSLISSTNDFNSLENNAGTVNTLDDHDMGIDSTTFLSNGIVSGPITLSPDAPSTIPLSEGDKGGTRNGIADTALLDARSNLTVDFGFLPGYSLGNRVWRDDGTGGGTINDGIRNGTEAGIQGVSVTLLNNLNTPIQDAFGNGTITTDASGYYRFDGLVPGTYKVRIDASNWTTGTKPLLGLLSSTNDFNSLENNAGTVNTLDDHDMGIDSTTFLTNGIVSGPITLSPDAPSPIPLTEGDTGGTRNGIADSALLDVRSNLTVDFGFLPGYSLGNRVWRDDGVTGGTINDGIRNGTEVGIANVSVTLLNNSNTPISRCLWQRHDHDRCQRLLSL